MDQAKKNDSPQRQAKLRAGMATRLKRLEVVLEASPDQIVVRIAEQQREQVKRESRK